MKFVVERVSNCGDNGKPCEEAFRDNYVCVDERNVDDPTKLRCMTETEWYGKGTNHRVENGYIKRDLDKDEAWFVNLSDLTQLRRFIDKYGEVIVRPFYGNDELTEIAIYDDYIE